MARHAAPRAGGLTLRAASSPRHGLVQQQHRQEADEDDGERAERRALELLQRRVTLDVGRKRLEVEGAQQKSGGKLFHAVHEHQQPSRSQCRHQERHVHAL